MTKRIAITPRPACEEDLDQVVAIEKYSNSPPWSKAAFAAEFQKTGSNFWVLTDDETDNIVYAYVVFSFPSEQAHIQSVAVKKEFRRQGYAVLLLRAVINYVLRKGGDSIVLEVRKNNIAALALYQQLGFVVIHTIRAFYKDGEDAYSLIFRFNRSKAGPIDNDEDTEQTNEQQPKNIN